MCYIIAHDKKQPIYDDDEISIGGRPIPKNATTEALYALSADLNFIDCCIKPFYHNYEVRWKMYNEAMKKLFKQIPTMKSKPHSYNKNNRNY